MAESRGSLIAKSVQKHAGRAKEKILQNLGKVDRTADEIFDEHLQNFTRQQNAANRLQKEFNNYIRCIRAVQAASKSFLEAVGEVYESQWGGHDLVFLQTQSVDMLYQDYSHKIGDQVLIPLNTYQSQFPEMRKKIDKRGRKLVDYDGQRHNFQALQMSMAKKRDDGKLAKGRELLDEAKRTYEVLNSELHDELPALHDSRILFLVTNLQTLFNAEGVFHSETAKVYSELEAIVDKLATDNQRGSYTIKKSNGASLPRKLPAEFNINNISPSKNNTMNMPNNSESAPSGTTPSTPTNSSSATYPITPSTPKTPTIPKTPDNDMNAISLNNRQSPPHSPVPPPTKKSNNDASPTTTTAMEIAQVNGNDTNTGSMSDSRDKLDSSPINIDKLNVSNNNATTVVADKPAAKVEPTTVEPMVEGASSNQPPVVNANFKVQELYDIPVGASTDNLPPGVLYRVKATYKYQREDVDELSFDVGETIQVIAYDDPEEQEEGWLMGMKEDSGERGMFPANFTKPL